jgi:hypothetical protein
MMLATGRGHGKKKVVRNESKEVRMGGEATYTLQYPGLCLRNSPARRTGSAAPRLVPDAVGAVVRPRIRRYTPRIPYYIGVAVAVVAGVVVVEERAVVAAAAVAAVVAAVVGVGVAGVADVAGVVVGDGGGGEQQQPGNVPLASEESQVETEDED